MERKESYKHLLDLAADMLEQAGEPLSGVEIWNKSDEVNLHIRTLTGYDIWNKSHSNLLKVTGKEPWRAIEKALGEDIKRNLDTSRFHKTQEKPSKYYLTKDNIKQPPSRKSNGGNNSKKEAKWNEIDLHPLLTYFVYKSSAFRPEKNILTKTIHHQKSKKAEYSQWLYPDLVGAYLPIGKWENEVIELGKLSASNVMKLYSFELKKSLNKGNCREYFFQAVSNSSWANEGYLVASNIKRDDDLLSELQRLNSSFGIGIIDLRLDTNDFLSDSSILFPAAVKPNMDWQTMNKICERSNEFGKFLDNVKTDFESKKHYKDDYEKIIPDPNKYINQHKMNV